MPCLAFIDLRPLLFVGGLPLFVGLGWLACRVAGTGLKKRQVVLFSAPLYVLLFMLFFTGYGPFVDQKAVREHRMTWEVKPPGSGDLKQAEVVLSFVDFPGHFIGEHSDELAAHLRAKGEPQVKVVFELSSDFGKVRSIQVAEVGGLRGWKSAWGYVGSSGNAADSPWD